MLKKMKSLKNKKNIDIDENKEETNIKINYEEKKNDSINNERNNK